MGMADHLTWLLRNVYAGQEATVRTGHGTTDWFQIGKGVDQGCILSPCLFNFYAEYIMWNARLDEAQDGIKIAGRNINNLRHVDDTTLMAEGEEELKSLLMKVKEETEKASLKFNIQKIKIMGPSPIISWQIDGETVTDFIFLGSKITADGDCSLEIKRCLLLERKAMTNLDSLLKSRDITLPTKIHLVKAMVFPVVMYGCESWTIKKAEHWRIDALELWCWRRLLRVPWTARRSNQSILKEISPKYGKTDAGAETPILWAPDVKNWLIGKDSDAGKDWGQEEKGTTGWNDWVASLTWWTWVWASSRCWWWDREAWHDAVHGVSKSWTRLNAWHELNWAKISVYILSSPTLGDTLDCSLPVSSVPGIFQARIWEWVTIFYSRGSSWPKGRTRVSCVSCIGRQIPYQWATWERSV